MTDNNQNNSSPNDSKKDSTKVYKEGGLIRWNAVIPFFIVVALVAAYFALFFDTHMKAALEWAGYKALGTEVNISSFNTSFIKGNVAINGLQITSAEQPDFNSLELGSIRFDVNWDALLRLKFVVEEMAVENVQFMSKRKYRGRVAPPEPPADASKPGLVDEIQNKAMGKIEDKGKDNLLGDLTAFLKTGDYKEQLNNIESQLLSKKMATEMQAKWQAKQTEWDAKVKALPKEADFKAYKTKFDAIKVKDFKTPQELDASVKQFNALKSEVDASLKTVNDTKNQFNDDLTQIKKDYAALDEQIKTDIASVKDHLKIPKLDSKQIAKSIFMDYLGPYIRKLDKINAMASKYLPPKYSKMVNEKLDPNALLTKKKKPVEKEEDDTIQPHPRAQGVTYEFPVKNGYPLFWIQTIKLSSKSNAQADYGDISGVIQNIVSNQRQIGKQTEMHISGDFKSQNVSGLKLDAFLNNLKEDPSAGMNFAVASYPLKAVELLKNNDGTIAMPSASIAIAANLSTEGFKKYDIGLTNEFSNVQFELSAKEKVVEEILKNSFSQLQSFDLQAKASGELSSLDFDVSSSLGEKLEAALSASVKQKIEELNKEIKAKIDAQIGKVKADIEKQISTLTKGYVGNANEAQAKLDAQKNVADEKIAQAKKDAENKAKGKVQEEGKKALDQLKKKFKF